MSPENDRVVATAQATLLATSRLETEIKAGEFVGMADDPGVGTVGVGPTPTEYLMMALASCTAITLRGYADRKYDYAGDITVDVAYHEPETVGASRYLQRTIRLSEEIPEQDFESMINIVERSPVTLLLQFAWSVKTDITNGTGEFPAAAPSSLA
jgi:putative redox protein